jgi:glucokinase
MTTAIGVVVTEHIVAGRLEDMRLAGETVRFPQNEDEIDALSALPVGDILDILANEIASVVNNAQIDAIGVAVPGVIRRR